MSAFEVQGLTRDSSHWNFIFSCRSWRCQMWKYE